MRKSDYWDPYSSDDDVEYIPHHVITNSSTIVEREKDVNDVKNLVESPSELAFNRAITVLFNQGINGTIATLFTNIFGRRDISDLINPELSTPSSDLFSQIESSPLNQSEKDLLSVLHICNRNFVKFYDSQINDDWSNVTPERFDNIGEQYGYIPIDRDVVPSSSTDHVTTFSSEKSLEPMSNVTKNNKI